MSQCPACNGLVVLKEACAKCDGVLIDKGSIEDFYGPYRPYLEESDAEHCNHYLQCTECGASVTWPVPVID